MGQIKHYNNGKWTIYTSGEGLSGYTGVTNTYYVGPDLNNDGNLTKANPDGSLVNLETGIRPYKVYTALLTQTGITEPTAIVLENTLGGVPNWSYDSTGYYKLNGVGLFNGIRAVFTSNAGAQEFIVMNFPISNTSDEINIYTYVPDTLQESDDLLADTPIEIRVYN